MIATRTLPGLVNQRGPGKQNYVNTLQTEPWQGGGVAGGGQSRTGHGNWFQSMNPFSTNSTGSVILEKTFIEGETKPFASGSALKNKKAKGKRGFGIGGPTYDLPPKEDMMDISGSSLVASDYEDRDRLITAWARRSNNDPSTMEAPSIVTQSSSSNNDLNMEQDETPEVDETAELLEGGLNIDTSNLARSPEGFFTPVSESSSNDSSSPNSSTNLSPSGPALSTEAITLLSNNFDNSLTLPSVVTNIGYGLRDSPSPNSSPEPINVGPSNPRTVRQTPAQQIEEYRRMQTQRFSSQI
jgi:hypothetical protein